jgi:N-acetylglutamate synthase-like GNAT family acetyltransferase
MTPPRRSNSADEGTGQPAITKTFSVRIFEPADRAGVLALYPSEKVGDNPSDETVDTVADLIDGAHAGGHRFWVAVGEGRVIGSVALVRSHAELAHCRAMSVDPSVAEHDHVVRSLGERVVADAWDQGYLKLVVHTPRSGKELKGAFHRVSFELSKETWVDGKHLLEFYQNIYARPLAPGAGEQEREVREAL